MSSYVDPDLWFTTPRFAQGTCLDKGSPVSAALATETAAPLPRPPPPSPFNAAARSTIEIRSDLFTIKTPINVNLFEQYLQNHPNRAYVESVCRGLREGFWPWADSDNPHMWKEYDNSDRSIKDPRHLNFLREQISKEVELGRYSACFGSTLLPGMYSSPIAAIPKSTPNEFRLVNDHSQGDYSPNSMIDEPETPFPLDTIADLLEVLLDVREGNREARQLILWKSDVKDAYRLLPMHPLWQIRQIVTFEGKRYVDRFNTFGSRAGGWVWLSFSSLILWIAIRAKNIHGLFGYVDDHFSWEFKGNVRYYEPYKKYLPRKQALYLMLWDELGVLHKEEKQLCSDSSTLEIIGLEVDPNRLSVGLSYKKRDKLFDAIDRFRNQGRSTAKLSEMQELAGLLQSALVAYPFGRPGLSALYAAISRRGTQTDLIPRSLAICFELEWLKGYILSKKRTCVERLKCWGKDDDIVSYVDACSSGLGIWVPAFSQGFQAKFGGLSGIAEKTIFDLEAMAIFGAVADIAIRYKPSRMVVFSDNENSVNMFESLDSKDQFRNALLMTFVNVVQERGIWCRFYHVPNEENAIADALSRFENQRLRKVDPKVMKIEEFGTLMKVCAEFTGRLRIS